MTGDDDDRSRSAGTGTGVDSLLRAAASAPERTPDDPDPQQLAHFRIVGRIGQGGMGIVFRAEDEKLRRAVALKVLPRADRDDDERRRRLMREARSAAAINHPNVAMVHDVGEADGRVYLAMELVEGETLRARLARGPLPLAEALRVGRAIARGLARAHAKGIVHRDLKPENVMIDPDGEPKILDFGLAKLREAEEGAQSQLERADTATQATREGRLLGTPGYMSPEQVRGKGVDARTDVFALGVVLYEMIAGERPFRGESALDLMMAVTRDAHPSLRATHPEVAPELEAIVDRCLAKSPDARFPSAREVADALEGPAASAIHARSVVGEPPAPRGRLWWLLLAGAAATAGVLGVRELGPQAPTPAASAGPGPRAASGSAAPASIAASPGHGVAVTDHPLPRTSSPEAAAAYASGLQHERDAEQILAAEDFKRAARLDPTLAAAQLRAVLWDVNGGDMHSRRQRYAAAMQYRSALDERDRLLLQVAEMAVSDAPRPDEWARRARAVADRFPEDAEAVGVYGHVLVLALSRPEEGRAALERALALDPQYGLALVDLSRTYTVTDPARTGALLDRCLELIPTAGTCMRMRAMRHIERGQCADVEADARRMLVMQPNNHRSFEFLAIALAARGAPVDGVREALARRVDVEPDEASKRRAQSQAAMWTALLVGDFTAAEAAARELDAVLGGSLVESDHSQAMDGLFQALVERGDVAGALREADAYDRRSSAWTRDAPIATRMNIAYLRHQAGRLDDETFLRVKHDLVKEALATLTTSTADEIWQNAFGYDLVPSEAADALATKPDGGAAFAAHGVWKINEGLAYLRSGRAAEALPPLREAAASCSILGGEEYTATIMWMRAHLALGQALEQTGDRAGACAAYAVVADRWRGAKPRSVTLEKARARVAALGCGR